MARPPRVDGEVRRALAAEGRALAVVILDAAAGTAPVPAQGGSVPPETPVDQTKVGDTPVDGSHAADRPFAALQERAIASLGASDFSVRYRFRFSPALALDIRDPAVLDALEETLHVRAVLPDLMGSGALNQSRPFVGADEAQALGFTGAGRVAAVLDTGVDTDHPDLEDAIIHQARFLRDETGGNPDDAEDDNGHGTNVAGIIAGRGTVAPKGIAPGALIVAVKVLDSTNRGYLSDWAAGVEHVVALHEAFDGIRVDAINMSLLSDADFTEACDDFILPYSAACAAAEERGIAVFASSGNSGSGTRMTSPACYSSVYSVGATTDMEPAEISFFTSRNALLDLLAPGQSISATGLGGAVSTYSGTSQACPHAVAAALVCRQIDGEIPPARILDLLRGTGVPVRDESLQKSFPLIDVLEAAKILYGAQDCNRNGVLDFFDIHVDGTSQDYDDNGVPDECDAPWDFRRGDPNGDGDADISDPIFILAHLFLGDAAPLCAEAADVNDDGQIDISDGISLLNYLFLGLAPPPDPGPPPGPCGPDPFDSPGHLGCARYDRC